MMNKPYITILLVLVSVNTIGQDLNDLIITRSQDSIKCNITLINDQSVFYQYKNKKNIKSTYISKEQIKEMKGPNVELAKLKNVDDKYYNNCDTCNNWITLFSDDTIYYDLNIKFIKASPRLIKSFTFSTPYSSSFFYSCDIKEASWNNIYYFTFQPDLRFESSTSHRYLCDNFLGYYIVKDKVSLIKYTSHTRETKTNFQNLPFPNGGGTIHGYYSGSLTEPDFCIEIDSKRFKIPKNNRQFKLAIKNLLYKDAELIEKIENRELKYDDVEEIVNIYNRNQ